MSMVFCRGCGKEIHSTAVSCPHCGAAQNTSPEATGESGWRAITALVLAGLGFVSSIGMDPYDKDLLTGIMMACGGALGFAIVSVVQKRPRKNLAITAIVLAVLGGLIAIGTTA